MTSSQKEESIPTGKSVEAYRRFLNMKNREYRVLVTLALMASLVVGNIAGTSVNVQAADNKDKSTKTKKIRREDIPNLETSERVKYEIAEELGLLDKVLEDGWKSLSSKETGRIGGIISKKSRKNETGNLQ